MIPDSRLSRGFSLIELSLILMIVSILGLSAMQTYRTWLHGKIAGDTESRRNLINDAMAFFLANYGRLPCPATPGLAPDNATAGHENCLTASAAVGYCESGLCRVQGARPAISAALVGTVPYAALGLSIKDAHDGWGNKISYAVTEVLTRTSSFNDQMGSIGILQGFRNATTGLLLGPSNRPNPDAGSVIDSWLFVFFSHGADGRGAWNYQGQQTLPCLTVGQSLDFENCDGDSDFTDASPSTGIYNNVRGPEFFDDAFSVYTVKRDNDKWQYFTTTGMRNKSGGRVGIGVTVPEVTLDVGGNILLEDFQANEYCSQPDPGIAKPAYCFSALMVGGTGVNAARCGDPDSVPPRPMLMKGVDGASATKLDCANVISTATLTPMSCNPGEYLKGIDAGGNLICQAP